jgi:DNA-binding SARP family transcriptional activator
LKLDVFLLGGFRAAVDDRAIAADAWQQRRARDLVKLLALAPRHQMTREQVMDALWPELTPDAAAANLRKAVHFARRALGSEDAVIVSGGALAFAPEAEVLVDTDTFEQEALRALRTCDAEHAAQASSRYAGDLLPEDAYEPWLEKARERLRRRHLQMLRVAGLWERIIEIDPVDEEAHRALIRKDLAAGNRAEALRRFDRLRAVLKRELGVAPDAQSQQLCREALSVSTGAEASPRERGAALLSSAMMRMHRGDLDQAEKEATAARAIAVGAGLGREVGEASALLGMVAYMRGNWRELFLREFLDTVQRPASMAAFVFEAHLCLAEFWIFGADGVARGDLLARELLAIAEKHGSQHGQAVATLVVGEAALLSGQLEAAEQALGKSAELHQAAEASSGAALAMVWLAEAALARGDRRRAVRILERARKLAVTSPLSSHLLVRVLGALVQAAPSPGEARAVVREAEEQLAGGECCQPCSMSFRAGAAITCARTGDLDAARSYLEATGRLAAMWQGGPRQASEWEARAALRLAEGRKDQAVALLHEATDLFERSGHTLAATRCRAQAAAAAQPA